MDAPQARRDGGIAVYFYPHVLTPNDQPTDGARCLPMPIEDNRFLVWVDLFSLARFTHPTAHILISGDAATKIGVEQSLA